MKSKAFDKLAFLAKAVSKDQVRWSMTEVYWDAPNSCLLATDGRRLHIWYLSSQDIKTYKLGTTATHVHLIPKENMIVPVLNKGVFPDYSKVIPKAKPNYTADFTNNKAHAQYADFSLATGVRMNSTFLDNLKDAVWNVTVSDPEKAVRFDGTGSASNLTAVLMPMSQDRITVVPYSPEDINDETGA